MQGISRNNLILPDLSPPLVDQRTAEDWLALLCNTAAQLKFSTNNIDNRETWATLLDQDPIIRLALIAKTRNPSNLAVTLNFCRSKLDPLSKKELIYVTNGLVSILDAVASWWQFFSNNQYADWSFAIELRNSIQTQLAAILNIVTIARANAGEPLDPYLKISKLKFKDPIWTCQTYDLGKLNSLTGIQFYPILTEAIRQFEKLKLAAHNSYQSPPHYNHSPDIALILAFLEMVKHSTTTLNTFGSRHLDFYYKNILNTKPNPAFPDQVLLSIAVANNKTHYNLPAGTKFYAGKNKQGEGIIFKSLHDAKLLDIELKELAVIHCANKCEKNIQSQIVGNFLKPTPLYPTMESPAIVGVALTSPILEMSSGERTINISSPAIKFIQLDRVSISYSSNEIWKKIEDVDITAKGLTLNIPSTAPPITSFTGKKPTADWPALRFTMQTDDKGFYTQFYNLLAHGAEIDVEVKNASPVILENSEGKINKHNPFFVFGRSANKESYLELELPELNRKVLQNVDILVNWYQRPKNWKTYYHHYVDDHNLPISINEKDFCINVFQRSEDQWHSIANEVPLFEPTISIPGTVNKTPDYLQNGKSASNLKFVLSKPDYGFAQQYYANSLTQVLLKNAALISSGKKGFLARLLAFLEKWLLPTKGFAISLQAIESAVARKSTYLKALLSNHNVTDTHLITGLSRLLGETFHSSKSISKSMKKVPELSKLPSDILHIIAEIIYEAIENELQLPSSLPNPPWEPKASSVKISYKATTKTNSLIDQHTFYEVPVKAKLIAQPNSQNDGEHYSLIPAVNNLEQKIEKLSIATNTLVMHFSATQFNDSISFIVKLTNKNPWKNTGNPRWWLLTNGLWETISTDSVSDHTSGLMHSGYITITLPVDAIIKRENRKDQCWIAVSLDKSFVHTDLEGIFPQVVFAERLISNTIPSNSWSLPANSINKCLSKNNSIGKIVQPLRSTLGKSAEDTLLWHTRVSTQLTTRNRAVYASDFEKLILQHYSDIFFARALPHTKANIQVLSKETIFEFDCNQPGHITIVVAPTRHDAETSPALSSAYLAKIQSDIRTLATSNCTIQLCNPVPVFVSIIGSITVKTNVAQVRQQIQDTIDCVVSPWFYQQNSFSSMPGQILISEIIQALDPLEVVINCSDLSLIFIDHNGLPIDPAPLKPWEIYISRRSDRLVFSSESVHV